MLQFIFPGQQQIVHENFFESNSKILKKNNLMN